MENNKYYPLTHPQQRIWYTEMLQPGTSFANIACSVRLKKPDVNLSLLEKAINLAVKHNDALRTRIVPGDSARQQYVAEYQEVGLEIIQGPELDEWLAKESQTPFPLTDADLFYFALLKYSEESYGYYMKLHHIISDGFSFAILNKQIVEYYHQMEEGKPTPEKIKPSFLEYFQREEEYLASPQCIQDQEYWLQRLANLSDPLNLQFSPGKFGLASSRKVFSVSEKLQQEIEEFCRQQETTLFRFMMAVLYVYLSRAYNNNDLVIGTAYYNRVSRKELNTIGMYVSTLPVRISAEDKLTFADLLDLVHEQLVSDMAHQQYPYDLLTQDLRKKGENPDSLLNINLVQIPNGKADQYSMRVHHQGADPSLLNMVINPNQLPKGSLLEIALDYRKDLFDAAEVEQLFNRLLVLIRDALQNPEKKLSQLEIMSEAEKQQVLVEFNDTGLDCPTNITYQEMFVQAVKAYPDKPALVFKDQVYTYRELDAKTNQLACLLRAKGVQADDRVAIMVSRSAEIIIGALAIIKAGGAYLPIDPDYPADRIRYMLEDSGAKIFLSQQHLKDKAEGFKGEWLDLGDEGLYQGDELSPTHVNKPSDLAYVIYTSGSTGKPKGVMVEHRNLINLCCSHNKFYNLTAADNGAAYFGFGFDGSVVSMFPFLVAGATLHIIPEEIRLLLDELNKYFEENQITITALPTQLCEQFVELIDNRSLRAVITGGEKLKVYKPRNYLLVNEYGPTENTVDSTAFPVDRPYINIPIGKPRHNVWAYVVDQGGNPQPIGVPGELWVAGAQVARGYLNRPDLTAEKFIPNPFTVGEENPWAYKTGDLVRWLPDGNLEYLGRIDMQVKIRGYRIELGEIESTILNFPGITDAVVVDLVDSSGSKYLCAYLVGEDNIEIEGLKQFLTQELPHYMMPSIFMQISSIPINPNGKVDRRALPEPDVANSRTEYVAPINNLQITICRLWEEILGVERVGIKDDFFALGGTSIKAITLQTKLQQSLGIQLAVGDLFSNPTPELLAVLVEGTDKYLPIPAAPLADSYPLTPPQRQMYILRQALAEGTVYNIPAAFTIKGLLNRDRLKNAFFTLIKRHPALRTYFINIDGEPRQKIAEQFSFQLICQEAKQDEVGDIIAGYNYPFNLAEPLLLRAGLLTVAQDEHILFFLAHHIILDGLSIDILVSELLALYADQDLPPVRIGYPDFAVWQQGRLTESALADQEKYWLSIFADEVPALELVTDYPRPPVMNHEGGMVTKTIDKRLTQALNKLAQENKTTLFTVLLTGYMALLARYAGKEDLVVGVPFAGRVHPDVERTIGMFVSTLPLRSRPEYQKTLRELLAEVKEQVIKAQENQDYPLETLIQKLGIRPDPARNSLFDVLFNFLPSLGQEENGDLKIAPYDHSQRKASFDLVLNIQEVQEILEAQFTYCTRLFHSTTVERMLNHYLVLLSALVENLDLSLKDLSLLANEEREILLDQFNDNYLPVPHDKTYLDLFGEQVAKAPDNIAVMDYYRSLTYTELDQLTDSLGARLQDLGVGPDKIVGIMVPRTADFVIGTLAIMKAGGAYLPISSDYPEGRIEHLITDSKISVLLGVEQFKEKAVGFNGTFMDLGDPDLYNYPTEGLVKVNKPSDLAYIIYTSGSTGKPKGVMISHTNLINLCMWHNRQYQTTAEDIAALYFNPSFDASVKQIFPFLIQGAGVLIIPEEMLLDISGLNEYLLEKKVTVLGLPTQFAETFMESCANSILKYVIVGGEKLRSYKPQSYQLVNEYGPTEFTVCSTYYPVKEKLDNIPIGKPIANSWAYVLDKEGGLQPIGVPGELCMAGIQIARGYLDRPELTAEKFVANPYVTCPENALMYKTGDLVRWLPDGNLEYLGRIDMQVKIRGYRIELGEIELAISNFPGITDAVVVDLSDPSGSKYLCAYFTAQKQIEPENLKQFLDKDLPSYMVPSVFMKISAIPINPNGKVDRKALPIPQLSDNKREYVAPRNEMEEKIAAIWQEILGVERVGIYDDFFDLGGHSLKVSVLINKVKKAFNVDVAYQDAFNTPILKDFVTLVNRAEKLSLPPIERTEKLPAYPLLAPQKKMINFALKYAGNSPLPLEIKGKLDINRLWQAWETLVERHETLRTAIDFIEGEPVQIVANQVVVERKTRQVAFSDLEQAFREFLQPFKLSEGPLWRVELWQIEPEHYIFMLDTHHIIFDGSSMGVLMKELATAYEGKDLPPLEIQYRDYAVWQDRLLKSGGLKKMEDYWLENLAGAQSSLKLPTDLPRQGVPEYAGEEVSYQLSPDITRQVYDLALQAKSTAHVLIMSVYAILLAKYSGKRDIAFEEGIAGRNYPEVENLIGMFVNVVPIRSLPKSQKSFRDFLTEMNQTLLKVYECQEYPVAKLAEKLNLQIDADLGSLQFDIGFVYQSMDIPQIQTADWEMKIYPLPTARNVARRELLLVVNEVQDRLVLKWVYRANLFQKSTIENMAEDFTQILDSVLAYPNKKLETLLSITKGKS